MISSKASRFNLMEIEDTLRKHMQKIDSFQVIEKRVEKIMARIEKMRKENDQRFDFIN